MRLRKGDLAIIVAKGEYTTQHAGRIVELVQLVDIGGPCWICEPDLRCSRGALIAWDPAALVPIRDNPGTDETLTWAPVPKEQTCNT